MLEENIYSDNNVSVTTARIIISGTTYALRNVASVKMITTPANKGCAMMMLIISAGIFIFPALMGIIAAIALRGKDEGGGGGLIMLLLFIGFILGLYGWDQLKKAKPKYHVAISSASGETHALTSEDPDYIEKIVYAINEAIIKLR